jgi:hypothetical protein
MRLYHFTPRHRLEPILRHGLSRGLTPVVIGGKLVRIPGYQWLTTNPDFRQSWNDASLLPFDRTAYRIQLAVPRSAAPQLLPWPNWKAELGARMMPGFDSHCDPKNWVVFKGTAPPTWFTHIMPNPNVAEGGGGRLDHDTLDNKKTRLLHLCEWFVRENDIHCREAIRRTDCLTEKAITFLEQMCGVIGYTVPTFAHRVTQRLVLTDER